MALTFIDTNKISRSQVSGAGEFAEILNQSLGGAQNVVARLRWLGPGQRLEAVSDNDHHQLIYLMQGEGTITLNAKEYEVAKGAGVYLGPSEAATFKPRGAAPLKLLHLVVPKQSS